MGFANWRLGLNIAINAQFFLDLLDYPIIGYFKLVLHLILYVSLRYGILGWESRPKHGLNFGKIKPSPNKNKTTMELFHHTCNVMIKGPADHGLHVTYQLHPFVLKSYMLWLHLPCHRFELFFVPPYRRYDLISLVPTRLHISTSSFWNRSPTHRM